MTMTVTTQSTFDETTLPGTTVEWTTTITIGKRTRITRSSGLYLGAFLSQRDGRPMHYFHGGNIGGTSQGNGFHGVRAHVSGRRLEVFDPTRLAAVRKSLGLVAL